MNKIYQNGRLDWAYANAYEDALIAKIDSERLRHTQHLGGCSDEEPCSGHNQRHTATGQEAQG
jgi:hypothetical protein